MQWRDWPRPLSPVALRGGASGTTGAGSEPAAGLSTALAPLEAKETYAGIAERPLFRPQRKPEPPPSAEPPPDTGAEQAGTLDGLDLTAILISPALTMAWIKDPNTPELKRLRLGDEQAGWSVKTILADRLVFERQGETHELLLVDLAGTKAALPAPTAPAPPRPTPPLRATPPQAPTPSGRPNPPGRPSPPGRPNPLGRPTPPGRPVSSGQPLPGVVRPSAPPQRALAPGAGQQGTSSPSPSPLQPRPNVRGPLPPRPQ